MMTRTATLHPATTVVERVEAVLDGLGRFPVAILQFLLRFSIAAVFWHSGMTKIASWDTTIALFRDEYMVPILPPELAASLAATVELTCPLLLVLGLATRLATLRAQAGSSELFVSPTAMVPRSSLEPVPDGCVVGGPGG